MKRFESPEGLGAFISQWAEERKATGMHLGYAGLARALGIDTRTLWSYAHPGESTRDVGETGENVGIFLPVIKDALQMIEDAYEGLLWAGKPVGGIFALKQIGWTDRQEQVISLDAESWAGAIERAKEHRQLKKQGKIEGKRADKGTSLPAPDADLE